MPNYPGTTKSWLDHQELVLVKGVYPVPGDKNSIEPKIDSIDLLNDKSGVSLDENGWIPQYPSLEGSGVWADSPLMIGRTPLVLTEGNVTEKMRLTIVASSTTIMLAIKARFSLFMRYVRDFSTDNYQINPVYLQWFASCGGGRQYALIYNMELDWDDKDSPAPTSVLTITLEREPYWRAVPPGASPVQWAAEFNNRTFDISKDFAATGLLQSPIVKNLALVPRSEFSSDASSLVSDNCMVIPANLIPGDAPALLHLETSQPNYQNLIVGKKTIKLETHVQVGAKAGTVVAQNNIINCNDGTLGTNASLANDTGASKAMGAGTAQRVEISFGTATNQLRWRSQYSNASGINPSNVNRFIGRWMVFLRCRQSSGSVGDISMYLRYGGSVTADTDGIKLNIVNPPVPAGGTGNTTGWGWVYMGAVVIPFNTAKAQVNNMAVNPALAGNLSNGLDNALTTSPGTLEFALFAARTAGAGLLYLNDLVLIPYDEGSITLEYTDTTPSSINVFDGTGYHNHGPLDLFSANGYAGSDLSLQKLTGPGIELTPGVENRLYLMTYDTNNLSTVQVAITCYIGLIPRWRGIRNITNIYG